MQLYLADFADVFRFSARPDSAALLYKLVVFADLCRTR